MALTPQQLQMLQYNMQLQMMQHGYTTLPSGNAGAGGMGGAGGALLPFGRRHFSRLPTAR
jgi:hypothetical protein